MRGKKQIKKATYTTINGITYKVIGGIRYTTSNRLAVNNYGGGATYFTRLV